MVQRIYTKASAELLQSRSFLCKNEAQLTMREIERNQMVASVRRTFKQSPPSFACSVSSCPISLSALLCVPPFSAFLPWLTPGPAQKLYARRVHPSLLLLFLQGSCAWSIEKPRISPSSFILPTTAPLFSRAFVIQRHATYSTQSSNIHNFRTISVKRENKST